MKNHQKKLLLFPMPPAETANSKIVVQIGSERFAIRWDIEELPPAAQVIVMKRRAKKVDP